MHAISFGMILLLGALSAFAPLSIDMYLPALPALERGLAAPAASVKLTLSAFLAGMAIGQAFHGPLSDRFGRKPPLVAGLVLYVLASIGCAVAPNVEVLVALRFLQALGGCAGGVIAQATVRDRVGGQEAARIFSMLMLVMGVAPILAPLLGGWLLVWADWRAVFWVLAGFGLVCLAATAFALDESRPPEKRTTGGVLAALLNYARLLGSGRFIGLMMTSGFSLGGMFAYITASPHLFIEVFGVSPQAYGWLFGLNAAGMIAASQINRALLGRLPVGRVLALGSSINVVAALVLLGMALLDRGGLIGILVPLFVAIASIGLISPNAMASALANEPKHAGSAAALMGVSVFLGGAISGSAVALFHGAAALSMAGVIAGSSLVSYLGRRLLVSSDPAAAGAPVPHR